MELYYVDCTFGEAVAIKSVKVARETSKRYYFEKYTLPFGDYIAKDDYHAAFTAKEAVEKQLKKQTNRMNRAREEFEYYENNVNKLKALLGQL